MYAEDTIAAIATPPGMGGIGVVRVSGPLAVEIASRVFSPNRCGCWQSHRLYPGTVHTPDGRALDEALAVVMRGPHSYTGEDVLEIQCHGSPLILRRVMASVLARGARCAEAGEFTRRAFLNGRLDLAQAEAVIELIRARTEAGADVAAEQLLGRLSRQLADLRGRLIDIQAKLEAQIDFVEDVSIDPDLLAADIAGALAAVEALLASYGHGRLIRDGIRVPITGKTNVGKSSLLNALLGEERAIVTALPGTTRDVVEEIVDFDGVPVVLSDTAGLQTPSDPAEEIGIRRAQAKVMAGDVVLAVFDSSKPLEEEDKIVIAALTGHRVVAVLNKSDLPVAGHGQVAINIEDLRRSVDGAEVVRTSALYGTGLDALRAGVLRLLEQRVPRNDHEPTIMLDRHRDALEKAAAGLRLALAGATRRAAPELVAVDVQISADHVGGITGAITADDVLDRIFSEFCIGK